MEAVEFFETSFFSRAARKVRFGAGNKGKSGGVRAIYYHHDGRAVTLLLVIYAKGRQDDMSHEQTAQLRALVKKELK